MKITVHSLVRNEENFIWYALNSVVDEVDEIMIWDMASTDKTVEIVKSITSPKIKLRETKLEGAEKVSMLRQKMLDETTADWIFILDGDEIWWDEGLQKLKQNLGSNSNYDVVVLPTLMAIGDIYHYQEKKAGKYKIGDKVGHYNVRAVRHSIPGLRVLGTYPNEAYINSSGVKVQDFSPERILFLDKPYLHASHLKRSSVEKKKVKFEIGEEVPYDFYYPEVFFKPRPDIVSTVWEPMGLKYKAFATIQTPLKKIKRRLAI